MAYAPAICCPSRWSAVRIPNVLVVSPTLPVKNTEELVAHAKKNPGRLSYSTSGVGNLQHLNGELLEELAGVHMVHIPYRGASASWIDVTSGTMTSGAISAAKSFIQAGKVKAIAMTWRSAWASRPRSPRWPNTSRWRSTSWRTGFGLFAPAGTPEAVVSKLNAAVVQALKDPGFCQAPARPGRRALAP